MATGLNWRLGTVAVSVALVLGLASSGMAADEPDLIFKRSTVFKWLTPNDKLATYGLDDPELCVAATPSEMFWSIWYILIN